MAVQDDNTLYFDIMLGDTYQGSFKFTHCPAFRIRHQDIVKKIEEKFPTLRGKDYRAVPVFDRRQRR